MSERVSINTVVGTGIYVEGNLTVHGSIQVEGTLKGNLMVTGLLIVPKEGVVEGNITVKEAVIDGTVNGNLTATHNVILNTGATLNGDLYTGKVTLSEGSKFNGKCTMIKRKELIIDPKTKNVQLVELTPEQILTQS
ncbi:MAG: polymer-forming cytoskeletal protein [bacterium]|nr:polymer-forming cytoskeletal protein [bacterium]